MEATQIKQAEKLNSCKNRCGGGKDDGKGDCRVVQQMVVRIVVKIEEMSKNYFRVQFKE